MVETYKKQIKNITKNHVNNKTVLQTSAYIRIYKSQLVRVRSSTQHFVSYHIIILNSPFYIILVSQNRAPIRVTPNLRRKTKAILNQFCTKPHSQHVSFVNGTALNRYLIQDFTLFFVYLKVS